MARVVSGSIGSIFTSLVVTPLEVVKVRIQAAAAESSAVIPATATNEKQSLPRNVKPCPQGCGTFVLNNGQMDCLLPKNAVPFFDQTGKLTQKARMSFQCNAAAGQLGTFGMIRRIFVQEGVHGIYAGLRPTLVMAVPNTVLYFSAYEEIVWRLRRDAPDASLSSWIPLVAGASARLMASTLTAPFELLRTRQAAEVGRNVKAVGLIQEFRIIVQKEGYGALYRGLAPTLWRDVPFSAVYWVSIEGLRGMWKERSSVSTSPLEQTGQAFINGAIAGTIAACISTPSDVVKTRLQSSVKETAGHECTHNGAEAYLTPRPDSSNKRPGGTLTYMRHIAHTEGLAGLWRGNQSRVIKVAPSCAIMLSSYELGKRLLE